LQLLDDCAWVAAAFEEFMDDRRRGVLKTNVTVVARTQVGPVQRREGVAEEVVGNTIRTLICAFRLQTFAVN